MNSVDDLTINYSEGDKLLVKELDKQILSKGAWSTIIFRYQEWDEKKQTYGSEKYSIRRYQKKEGEYKQRSKFNISSREQAEKIIGVLTHWVNEV